MTMRYKQLSSELFITNNFSGRVIALCSPLCTGGKNKAKEEKEQKKEGEAEGRKVSMYIPESVF